MSKRGILGLSLVAALLLAYVLVFERTSVTSKERSARAGRVLVSFVRDKVERLTVQRKGTTVVLVRKPQSDGTFAGFRVLEPYLAKADDDAVDQVLGELEWLSAKRTLDAISKEDEARFGLAAPRYRVRFQAGRDQHTLAIGQADVHGDSVYVRVDHEPRAYVVPKSVVEVLDHEPGHFRDKQLFPELTVAWAQKLDVEHGAGAQHVSKQAGRWWLSTAPKVYADGKRIDELLHTLSELRAAHYLEPSEYAAATSALASSAARVTVVVVPDETREDKQAKTLTLVFAGPCAGHPGERYARAEAGSSARAPSTEAGGGSAGALVCVSASDLSPFELGSAPLREPRLFSADVSAVESFVLAAGKRRLALARDGERWKTQSGSAAESVGSVDREAVEAWLADLAAARAVRFGPATEFQAVGSLALELADDKREQLAFGALNELGELPVKRGDEPALVLFSAGVFDRLQPSAGRFASLELWSARQPSEVLRVEASAGGRERVTALDAGQWRLADAGVAPASTLDSERVRELVRALVDFRARSYVSDQPRPGHGVGVEAHGVSAREPPRDVTRIKLGLRDGSVLSLEIGGATDRGAYARVDGRSIVEVGAEVVAAIVELAGGPRAPPPVEEDEHEEDEHEDAEHEGHEH
jgi:hypothetical protein